MSLLTPLYAQVALTFIVMFIMVGFRFKAVSAGIVKPEDVSLRQPLWPEGATKASNNFLNQFEVPVLFFGLVILHIVTQTGDQIQLYLAWVHVIFRVLHAIAHIFYNNINIRTLFFVISTFTLMGMWVRFALMVSP